MLDAPWARPGWGGPKTELDTSNNGHCLRYHPLKDFGGTWNWNCLRPWQFGSPGALEIRRPPTPCVESQRVWSTEGQCEGTTRSCERCKVDKSSDTGRLVCEAVAQDEEEASELASYASCACNEREAEQEAMNGPRLVGDASPSN